MLRKRNRVLATVLTATTVFLLAAGCGSYPSGNTPISNSTGAGTTSLALPANITATTTATTAAPTTTKTAIAPERKVIREENGLWIKAPLLCQYPEYPTGCEVTAAVMALRYAGENITIAHFIDNLDCSRDFYHYEGVFYGPSPYEYFLGDPRSEQSYGCMAPVIEKALIRHFGSDERVINTTGTELRNLCEQYIDRGIPVIIWGSMGMSPLLRGRQWTLPDGTLYTWPSGEHCLLLVGYDSVGYYLNDPTYGKTVRYDRETVEQRYADLGKQALVVQ